MVEIYKTEKELVRKFYSSNLPCLPPYSQWRQYRCRLWNGGWLKIRDIIKTPKQLQRWLVNVAPRDVYFMTSRFLNAPNIGAKRHRKAGWKWSNHLFLGAELYFDFDDVTEEVVDEFISQIKSDGYKDLRKVKTGRGFHIWVLDWELKHPELRGISQPREREARYMAAKIRDANYYKKLGYNFDFPITIDTRRIVRVPNTMHGNSMKPIGVAEVV